MISFKLIIITFHVFFEKFGLGIFVELNNLIHLFFHVRFLLVIDILFQIFLMRLFLVFSIIYYGKILIFIHLLKIIILLCPIEYCHREQKFFILLSIL
jgi:hypothetical protein